MKSILKMVPPCIKMAHGDIQYQIKKNIILTKSKENF